MAVYPTALVTIPDDGTYNHAQVAREVEAVEAELGVNPSGSQSTVASRFTTVESRVTAVEGATSTAGVEVAAAQLTTQYSVFGQASQTTFTDVGLSIAVPAQTRAYNLLFTCQLVITTNSSFVGPKYQSISLRIVDSGVTVLADSAQIPLIVPVSGAQTGLFAKGVLCGRIPPGQAATTWKVQARTASVDANTTGLALFNGAGLGTPSTGVQAQPAQIQAITV